MKKKIIDLIPGDILEVEYKGEGKKNEVVKRISNDRLIRGKVKTLNPLNTN